MKDLDRSLELVADQGENVSISSIGQDDGVALDDLAQRGGVVAQAGGLLEVEGCCGSLHLRLHLAQIGTGSAGHEGAEVLGERPVVFRIDATHARRRALVDIAQQAGAA